MKRRQNGKGKSRETKVLALIFITMILPALIGGGVMTFFGVREIYLARESRSWPSTDGTIKRSGLKVRTGGSSTGPSYDYDADIVYQFAVDGQTRRGNEVTFGVHGSTASSVQTLLNRYPTGKTVNVYYRASAPDSCILEPGLKHGQFWALPSIGLFIFLFMSFVTIFVHWTLNRQKKQIRRGRKRSRGFTYKNPPRSVRLQRDGQALEITLRKNRIRLLVQIVAVMLCPILFIYLGFVLKEGLMFVGVIGVVLLVIFLVYFTLEIFATETIRLETDKVEIRRFKLRSEVSKHIVRMSDIKNVIVSQNDNNLWFVDIRARDEDDGMSIDVGSRSWISFEVAQWIRKCILKVRATAKRRGKR